MEETKEQALKRLFNEIKTDSYWNPGLKLSDEELRKKAEWIYDESEMVIGEVIDENYPGRDILIPFESILYLTQYPVLLGLYGFIRILSWYDLLSGIPHKELAEFLNISEPSFLRYRNALVNHNIIRLEKHTNAKHALNIVPLHVPHLEDRELVRMLDTQGKKERLKLLLHWRSLIHPLSRKDIVEQAGLEKKQQEQLFFDQKVKVEAHALVKKRIEEKKKDEQKFPPQDYTSIIDGYRKAKGVFLKTGSPDEARVRRAAKQMFLSGHKVLEIVNCMKFFKEHSREEGYEWMIHWTIETVMKKMPEFKAGALRRPEIGDDLPEL